MKNGSNLYIPRKKIEKAGTILASKDSSQEEINQALIILNNWRSSHAYPLKTITNKLTKDNSHAIVVQRLKRLDSIIGKLERFPEMNLYRMHSLLTHHLRTYNHLLAVS